MNQNVKVEPDDSLGTPASKNKMQGVGLEASKTSPPADESTSAQSSSGPADEATRLKELQADIRDQDALERDITRQVFLLFP